ncbi:hypothetical protein [Ktedonobacter robiniae]|uniref:ABC transporter ATP-binding protein n=1 Tax=Ktedonobacter robiniae TaxID=2778365 RepID=A0ABQ3V374_9CHLR|nr:hypothetical protein [Ktedonobacter robiniae]GHO59340.1 hypothetical protein KSB_78150 [Ktedonobacter robiniae]
MTTSTNLTDDQAQKPEAHAVIEVQEIRKSLPLGREKIEILKGISFQVMSGEFVSIVVATSSSEDRDAGRAESPGPRST